MCYKIETPFVLIHALKNRESCSILEIAKIKRKVEKEIPLVFLNVSRNSILETISSYPSIFSWKNDEIKRKENTEEYFEDDVIGFFSNFNKTDAEKSLEIEVIKLIEDNE